jgi:hypothetical protein
MSASQALSPAQSDCPIRGVNCNFMVNAIVDGVVNKSQVFSDLMNSTIWSSAEWTLPFGFMSSQNGHPTLDPCQGREELGKASLIELDRRQNKNLTLQGAVINHLME